MDENKLKKLKEYGYEIQPCCNYCKYSLFPCSAEFGICKIKTYWHGKHSDSIRQLSINKYGKCNDGFEVDLGKLSKLGSYSQFFNK